MCVCVCVCVCVCARMRVRVRVRVCVWVYVCCFCVDSTWQLMLTTPIHPIGYIGIFTKTIVHKCIEHKPHDFIVAIDVSRPWLPGDTCQHASDNKPPGKRQDGLLSLIQPKLPGISL